MLSLDQYIAAQTGKVVPFANCPPGSCMALMHDYLALVFGLTDPTILATPLAYQVFANFASLNGNQYFTAIANTPEGVPSRGDIILFAPNNPDTQTGEAGHVAIVVLADVNQFSAFEQDYPYGSPAHIGLHSYGAEGKAILGWLTPRKQGEFIDEATLQKYVNESMAFEAMVTSGYSTPNDVTSKIDGYEQQISLLQKQLGDATTQNQSLQLEIKQTKDQMAQLADITQQQASSDSTAIDTGLNASSALTNITHDINLVASTLSTPEKLILYPPVGNVIGAIQTLQNQLKAAQIQLTKQAKMNEAIAQSGQQVANASKGFFSRVWGWVWVSKPSK